MSLRICFVIDSGDTTPTNSASFNQCRGWGLPPRVLAQERYRSSEGKEGLPGGSVSANSVAQLDKEVKAQVETLKGELEKAKQGEAETAPGSIQLSIVNAQRADEGKVQVLLDDKDTKIADEMLQGANAWVHIGVAPGQYRLTVKAAIGGTPVSTSTAIVIKTAEISKAEISLPV